MQDGTSADHTVAPSRRRRFSTALSDRPTAQPKRCAGIWLFICKPFQQGASNRSRRAVSGFMRPTLAENGALGIKLLRLPSAASGRSVGHERQLAP